uniref:Lysyl oxidase homolog n=1 Tax=Amazona collaria TaxID=241587 RepID=A0A8B9FRJ2_9PSIT
MFPTALWHCFIWKLWNPQPPVCCLSTPSNVPKIQLRLAGQKRKHNEGRVEVFYSGEWGTVCDDDFSIHAAHVVCRELGYVEAVSWLPSSKYGKGEGKIWMDNVHCNGKEPTLAACTSNGWGVTDCKHTEDVGVVCSEKRIPGFKFDNSLLNQIEVEDIRIRPILATYRKRVPVTEGYVEVKDEGAWKQICDKHWTMKNSRVVCGMFGFPSERKYNTNVYKRKQHYWAYSMDCSGNEAHISSCKLGNHLNVDAEKNATCDSGMPAVVSCVPGRAFAPSSHSGFRKAFRQEVPQGNQPLVRLKGGANTGEGRVEVLKNGEWGTVCDDNWNLVSASVVCRELGFGSAKEAITGARLGQGMGPIHLNEIDCTGFEKSVTDCKFNMESQGCNHEEDAAVRCNIPAMGFQNQETWYWHGDISADSVVMSGVKCSGTEMSLAHCRHDGAHVSCPRGGGRFGAGVSCSETAPDLVLNAELVEQTAYLEDRPMFMLQCALEENCLASSAANTSITSGYRRLLRFSSQIHNNGQSDFRPKNGRHAWVWHDCHRHYHSMEVFTHYDLLNLNGTKVAEGHKASFCLEDTECEADVQKQYECANFGEQGITVGCWDVYRHDIDCQWIDITDVPPGDYLFQVVINPNYEVAESDYSNNVMKCRSRYDGQRIWMYNCHIGESYRAGGFARYTGFNTEINSQCLPPSNQSQREGKLQGWLRPFKECFS